MKKKMYFCRSCGSDQVYSDAYASLNDPQDVITYDDTHCMDCDCSVKVVEREVEVEDGHV